ncbi:hypothetical protein LRP88_12332 [Fusarium phalaenopsidis]
MPADPVSQDSWAPVPVVSSSTHDESSTALDQINQPSMLDTTPEAVADGAAHEATRSRPLPTTDAAQTDSQPAPVHVNANNPPGTESQVISVNQDRQRSEHARRRLWFNMMHRDMIDSLSPYDRAAIN